MQDITNSIHSNKNSKEEKSHINEHQVFNITLLDIYLALLTCIKSNHTNSIILESTLKESQLKFIQIYKQNIDIYFNKTHHYFYISNNTIFHKKNKENKFKPITKEDETHFLKELNLILQQEDSYSLWRNISKEETSNKFEISNGIELNDLEETLIQNNYRLLKNKKENFDTHFTNYLLMIFEARKNDQIVQTLTQIKQQFNFILSEEKTSKLKIKCASTMFDYTLNISENEVTITLSTFEETKYIQIKFGSNELFLNNEKQNLSYFSQLAPFFTQLDSDISSNKAEFIRYN